MRVPGTKTVEITLIGLALFLRHLSGQIVYLGAEFSDAVPKTDTTKVYLPT